MRSKKILFVLIPAVVAVTSVASITAISCQKEQDNNSNKKQEAEKTKEEAEKAKKQKELEEAKKIEEQKALDETKKQQAKQLQTSKVEETKKAKVQAEIEVNQKNIKDAKDGYTKAVSSIKNDSEFVLHPEALNKYKKEVDEANSLINEKSSVQDYILATLKINQANINASVSVNETNIKLNTSDLEVEIKKFTDWMKKQLVKPGDERFVEKYNDFLFSVSQDAKYAKSTAEIELLKQKVTVELQKADKDVYENRKFWLQAIADFSNKLSKFENIASRFKGQDKVEADLLIKKWKIIKDHMLEKGIVELNNNTDDIIAVISNHFSLDKENAIELFKLRIATIKNINLSGYEQTQKQASEIIQAAKNTVKNSPNLDGYKSADGLLKTFILSIDELKSKELKTQQTALEESANNLIKYVNETLNTNQENNKKIDYISQITALKAKSTDIYKINQNIKQLQRIKKDINNYHNKFSSKVTNVQKLYSDNLKEFDKAINEEFNEAWFSELKTKMVLDSKKYHEVEKNNLTIQDSNIILKNLASLKESLNDFRNQKLPIIKAKNAYENELKNVTDDSKLINYKMSKQNYNEAVSKAKQLVASKPNLESFVAAKVTLIHAKNVLAEDIKIDQHKNNFVAINDLVSQATTKINSEYILGFESTEKNQYLATLNDFKKEAKDLNNLKNYEGLENLRASLETKVAEENATHAQKNDIFKQINKKVGEFIVWAENTLTDSSQQSDKTSFQETLKNIQENAKNQPRTISEMKNVLTELDRLKQALEQKYKN